MGKPALQVYTLEQSEEWDHIVRSFEKFDTYWLSGYVKAFRIHGDGEPLLFYFSYNTTRAINVVMRRSIIEDKRFKGILDDDRYYDFSTPYGYGGWIIEGEDTEQLFKDYERWCLRNNIVSEFVRFHPMSGNEQRCENAYDVVQLGEVVHMDLSSPDLIWENMSSKNRNVIRKAIKNGVKIYNGRYPGVFDEFRAIYNSTMDKDDAEDYYYFSPAFYTSVLDDLPENAQMFWAELDGKMIAGAIMLSCNGRMNYHLSGSLREYSSMAATNLILYKAALWGSVNGCKTLYLGGGVGSGEDSLFKFKRAFYKGELRRFSIGKKVFDPDVYQELTMMRGETIENVNYFPVYRG